MYGFSKVNNCVHFSQTIWLLNALFTTMTCRVNAESVHLKSTCNPVFESMPIITPINPTEKDDSPAEVFTGLSWSKMVYTKCMLHAKFTCIATYPIEWVEHFEQDVEQLTDKLFLFKKSLWLDRILSENILEHASISSLNAVSQLTHYSAYLEVNYNRIGPLCAAANYTCQSVSNPRLQSRVVSVVDRENEIIRYEHYNGPSNSDNDKDANYQNTTACDTYIEVVAPIGAVQTNPRFRCSSSNKSKLTIFGGSCDSAVHCNTLFNHFKQGCVKRVNNNTGKSCKDCAFKKITSKRRYHPGFLWCEDEQGKILTAIQYFFSIIQSVNLDTPETPEMYLNWDEADPQKMLYLVPLAKEIFVGETKEITCKVSRYYFSYGYRFGFEYQNGTRKYTKHIDGKAHTPPENVNTMTMEFDFTDPTLKRIYCFASVWNSTVWINQSIEIHLMDVEQPQSESETVPNTASYPDTIHYIIIFPTVALFILAILALRLHHQRMKIRILTNREVNQFYNGGDSGSPAGGNTDYLAFTNMKFPKRYQLSLKDLEIEEMIGSGQFGVVNRGILSKEIEVAIKIPRADCGKDQFKSTLAELKILCHVGEHPNIVSLLGAYTKDIANGKLHIVMEYCKNDCLLQFLRQNREGGGMDSSISLYGFALQIASGMEYVAEKRVIHGDLAARNVLLSSELTCKIADFGLSRWLYEMSEYVKSSQGPLPWRWMAPESLRDMEFTVKSDVWSYGVTLWEIFSLGSVPYPGMNWTVNYVTELENGMRMEKAVHATDNIHAKMLECWNGNPEGRPTFTEMKEYFVGLRNEHYLNLDHN